MPTRPGFRQINVRAEDHDLIRQLANAEDRSLATIVRLAVRAYAAGR